MEQSKNTNYTNEIVGDIIDCNIKYRKFIIMDRIFNNVIGISYVSTLLSSISIYKFKSSRYICIGSLISGGLLNIINPHYYRYSIQYDRLKESSSYIQDENTLKLWKNKKESLDINIPYIWKFIK